MVNTVRSGDSLLATIALMSARRAAAVGGNPQTRGVMSTPPTITTGASDPGVRTAKFPPTPSPTDATVWSPYVTCRGGDPAVYAYSTHYFLRGRSVTTTAGGARAANAMRYAFRTSAPIIDVKLTCQQVGVRVLVDGQYASLSVISGAVGAGGAPVWLTIDFTSAGGRGWRTIEIEGERDFGICQIQTTAIDTVVAPEATSALRINVGGASLTEGPTAGQFSSETCFRPKGYARIIGDWLGIDHIVCSAIGGTGWTTPNTTLALKDRWSDLVAGSPTAIVIFGDLLTNDAKASISAATTTADVSATLAAIRAASPAVPIIVFGAAKPTPAYLSTSAVTAVETAAKAGFDAVADGRMAWIPVSNASPRWCDGTGYVASATGVGPSDWIIGDDQVHPTPAGHAYYGRRAADAIMAAIAAMR